MSETLWSLSESWPHNGASGRKIDEGNVGHYPNWCRRCQLQAMLRLGDKELKHWRDTLGFDETQAVRQRILGVPEVKNG